MDPLVRAHILAEQALRAGVLVALARIWAALPGYDRRNVDEWLSRALPVVAAAQRQSAAVTNAYLAHAMGRPPVGLDLPDMTGGGVRNGTAPEVVYERPFVTVWSALGAGADWEQAVADGLARAKSSGAMDVQLSMRASAEAIDRADPNIYGYKRVANPTACAFCKEVDGAYVKGSAGLVLALHNHCGCGLEVLKEPHDLAALFPDGTPTDPVERERRGYPATPGVVVREHGELGPVLVDPSHNFTSSADLAHAH